MATGSFGKGLEEGLWYMLEAVTQCSSSGEQAGTSTKSLSIWELT